MNVRTVGEPADVTLADELAPALSLLHILLREAVLPPRMSLAQARALATLRDSGPQRVTDLAAMERVTQPTISALVGRMERAGWVERGVDEVDKRAVMVRLSATGAHVLEDLTAARVRLLRTHLDALPEAERTTLAAAVPILNKIISAARQSGHSG